jgi:iron complex outermembrane receptor protein
MKRFLSVAAVAAAMLSGAALAQSPTPLAPLEVNLPRVTSRWADTPIAIGSVDADERVGDPQLALDEALSRLPGLYVQNRYNLNQGLRLSIRGFGSRASFGVRGIRVLLDDIPLTLPDGQTDLDALDLALVENVEVLRGPASALYGNGAGGVLAIRTRDRPQGQLGRVDLAVGELGERRLRGEAGMAGERFSGLVSLAHREVDTHRANQAAESLNGAARGSLALGGGQLGFILQTLDIDAEDAGGLNRSERDTDRGLANPNALRFAAGESIEQQRGGLSWTAGLDAETDLRLRGWFGRRDFANRLPFANGGQTHFDRRYGGVGAQLDHRLRLGDTPHRLSIGADLETQRDDRRRFDNGEGGVRGEQTLEQAERARSVGVFVHDHIELGDRWRASAGLRHDRIRLSVADRFLADGDDSGQRDFDKTSVTLGLGYRLDARSLLFARYGSGFETPTNNELANPDGGGFNPALGPADARNFELGIKHDRARLRAELVGYLIRNDGELLRFELDDQPGRSFFRNAGSSQREGLEASLVWEAHPGLRFTAAYTLNDFRFREYRLGGDDFSGKVIPGVPRQQLFTEVAWRPQPRWVGRLQALALDRVYADDANRERVAGYVVANARLAWEGRRAGARATPYLAINNLFDIDYTDNLRVNAGFGRYYEPAAGRVAVAGLSLWF